MEPPETPACDPGKLRLIEDAEDWQPRTGTSQSRSFRKLARLTGTDGRKFLQDLGAGPSVGVWPWWPRGGPACGVGWEGVPGSVPSCHVGPWLPPTDSFFLSPRRTQCKMMMCLLGSPGKGCAAGRSTRWAACPGQGAGHCWH